MNFVLCVGDCFADLLRDVLIHFCLCVGVCVCICVCVKRDLLPDVFETCDKVDD